MKSAPALSLFLLLSVLPGLSLPAQASARLKAVYGDFVTPPAVVRDVNRQANSGYLIDIYRQLSAELAIPLDLVVVPRTQIASALLHRDADIYCRANPAWYPEPLLRWSPPLLAYNELILSHQPLTDVAALVSQHARLGTVRGYQYPQLDGHFHRGQLSRVDVLSSEQLADLLMRGQVDAVVMSEPDARYYLSLTQVHQLVLHVYQIYCMYSPNLTPAQRTLLNSYIGRQAKAGQFRALLDNYSFK